MNFSTGTIYLLVTVLVAYGCGSETINEAQDIAEQKEIQKDLQKQLDDEFGKYAEEIKPEDRKYYRAYDKALALWETTFHEMYIQTSAGNAHVIVSGLKDAEPVVLLHGMNASSTMWYPNIKAFSQNYRVYAIDNLQEPGKSQLIGKVKDIDEVVNWYIEIFDQLKLDRFTLIGASKGGWLAVKIALKHRSRISNLILLSPLQTFVWIRPGSEISSSITYSLAPGRKQVRRSLKNMSTNVGNIKQPYIEQYFLAAKKAKYSRLLFQMTPFTSDKLNTLNMPVLVLIGDHDIINNEKSVEKAKEFLPHIETGIVKNAGHFLSMDQSETVNARILDFLNAHSITHVKADTIKSITRNPF